MIDLRLSFHEFKTGALVVKAESDSCGETEVQTVRRAELLRIREEYEARPLRGADGELAKLGGDLFREVFAADVGILYERARGSAAANPAAGAGLRVSFGFGPRSALHGVPWELLHDGARFLAQRDDVFIVRAFNLLDPRLAMAIDRPPLRVLFTAANPRDLPQLDLGVEEEKVRTAYRALGPRARVTVEPHLSRARLATLFQQAGGAAEPFHVWHHCGHGGTTAARDRFWLQLERSGGRGEPVAIAEIADILGACPGLRLAVLNCCHGGSLAGLAPELARLNVPVVIGLPRAVHDLTAVRFAAALHAGLVRLPIEQAVGMARHLMSPGTQEWTLPLLLSRRRDHGPLLAAEAAAVRAATGGDTTTVTVSNSQARVIAGRIDGNVDLH